jgi:hypothetical protein
MISLTETEEHDEDPRKDLSVDFPNCLVLFSPTPPEIWVKLLDILLDQRWHSQVIEI